MDLTVISFKRKWSQLKKHLTEEDLDFFYNKIHAGREISRVLTCSMREDNPLYMGHYFPTCRCHTNVLFAIWMLNNRQHIGKYKIITNDKHSAIINTETYQIYDPTYDANGTSLDVTLKQFQDTYQLVTLMEHLESFKK